MSLMWFTAIIPLLSGLFGESSPIGKYFSTKATQIQMQAELAMQIEKDKFLLSAEMARAAVDSEANKLRATSRAFKNVVFFMLSAPIILTIVNPEYGRTIFDSLSIVPSAYMKMYFAIIGVIWGLPVTSSAFGAILDSVGNAFDARNDRQIAKITAIGQQQSMNLDQAKAQIFEIMKNTVHLNGYTQAQVDQIEPVLNKVLGQVKGDQ